MNTKDFWSSIKSKMFDNKVGLIRFEGELPQISFLGSNKKHALEMIVFQRTNYKIFFVTEDGDCFYEYPIISVDNAKIVTRKVYGDTFEMFMSTTELTEIYDKFVDSLKNFYEKRNFVHYEDVEDLIHEKLKKMFKELEENVYQQKK